MHGSIPDWLIWCFAHPWFLPAVVAFIVAVLIAIIVFIIHRN